MSYTFTHKDYMTDDELDWVFGSIRSDPVLCKTVFYDGVPADWSARVREWWLVSVTSADDAQVGVFWLNGYQGRAAQIHFAVFEAHRAEAVHIGKATMNWLSDLGWLHSVYGMTPATHRHVFPFIEALGFKILGRLPGACWLERKQKYVDGVVSVFDFRRTA